MSKKFFMTAVVSALIQWANAQADSANINVLDDVEVTTSKSPKKLSETGKVLTIITQQQLQQNSSHSLGEILNRQSGIIVAGSTATPGTNQSVYLRGANAGNTLVLVDGVPIYDASGISSEFDINYININQVERIEILKGAQSTLYGSDAVAGVINIITKKTALKNFSGFTDASAGSFGTINTAAGVKGFAGKFQYSLGGSYIHSDGFSSAYDSTESSGFDKDGYTQQNLNASAAYIISSAFRLRAFAQYNQYKAAIDAGAYTDDKDYNLKNKNSIAGITGTLNSGKNYFVFTYQYNYINRSFIDDSTDIGGFSNYQNGLYKSYSHFAEIYNNITFSNHTALLIGAEYRHNSTNQSYQSESIYGPYKTSLGRDSAHTDQGSLYASFFIQNLSGFNAEIGGRINDHSVYGWNGTYSFNPSYNINKNWKIFATIASAYHIPSLYQLYSEYGNKDLKPEKSVTFEGGIQYATDKLQVRTAYFKRNIKDVIGFYTDPVTYAGYYINADKQKDNGLEAEASFLLNKAININANYTYVEGKTGTISNGKDTAYFNLYRRPRNVLNVNANWQIKALLISAKLHMASFYYEAVYAAPPEKFSGYYTIDLYTEYKLFKNLFVFADARNITNQKYFELPGYNSKRFNIMAGMRVSF